MSYGIYVGKNHTADGIAYLAGYGDEPSSHSLTIVPRLEHAPESTITVGVTPSAGMPGILSEIPQVPETARHICVNYSFYLGVPAPLTNGGLNEYGVAVRDIWSSSRQELKDMTPMTQTGPNYSDLARIVIERAKTAREGVLLIGYLIAEYGYSTYGGNSHIIADPDEAWVVIEFAGGQGLWAAERLGPDSIRASRPGYINEIPVHNAAHDDYLYSHNLVSFAVSQGWYDAKEGTPFNVNDIYGDGKHRWDGVQWIEEEMAKRAAQSEKVTIEDMMWAVRCEKLTGDTAGYGQVVPLYNPRHPQLRHLWHTQVGAIAAPFVPVYMGCETVPEEFREHRYLTDSESSRFSNLRHEESLSTIPQGIESTRSATAVFKRLMYLVFQHADKFLPEITEVWEALEKRLLKEHSDVSVVAETLLDADKVRLAQQHLTYYSTTELLNALNLAETLACSIEARTRILYGISDDMKHKSPDQIW
ncbi:MAG: dipeptidase [Rhodospirillales bacterium]|jgi:dipeptidase|nr:dipeptidase [Rhodospirillales bacterium]MBT4038904.1 dipeptidase [Rhodospirillales bacterium]MBT4625239.1 dipeptidase [Rhodospirillales bacterium]MBT5351035.1 dipeptidase [Rhodospirillales bacterium]MBT5521278.1 dipeptidase [Rhodospirillales bacterium]